MFLELLFLVDFWSNFDKIDSKKHVEFCLFFVLLVVFFLTLETLKIVLPLERELNFNKIAFFTLDEK